MSLGQTVSSFLKEDVAPTELIPVSAIRQVYTVCGGDEESTNLAADNLTKF